MIWRKNAVSYGLWSAYLLGAGVLFVYGVFAAAGPLGWNNRYGAGVVIGLGIAAIFLVFLLIRRFTGGRLFIYGNSQTGLILESLLVVGLFAAGTALRIANITYAGEEAAYYDMARVTQDSEIPQVTHGATYFYLRLLRGLFLLLGNKWMAGIWLQMGLQLLGCLLLFLGVRKLAGRVPGVIMTAFYLLPPDRIAEGLLYSPKMLYLCFYGTGLLLVSLFLSKCASPGKKTVYHRLFGFILGLFPGLVCYLDITGTTLLLAAASVLYLRKGEEGGKYCLPELLSFLMGSGVSFCTCLALNAFVGGKTFQGVIKAWFRVYEVKGWNTFFWLPEGGVQPVYYCLSVLLILGIFSYWCRKKHEKLSLWVLMSLGLTAIEFFCMTTDNMSGRSLLYWMLAVMASIAVAECFTRTHRVTEPVEVLELEDIAEPVEVLELEDIAEPVEDLGAGDIAEPVEDLGLEDITEPLEALGAEDITEPVEALGPEDITEPVEALGPEDIAESMDNFGQEYIAEPVEALGPEDIKEPEETSEQKQEIIFIDNPLPLPKKHVKKVMEFSFEPEESQMTFDVEIPDNDDFDIT